MLFISLSIFFLPLFSTAFLAFLFLRNIGCREGFIIGWIFFCSLLLGITEILGALNALDHLDLLLAWSFILISSLITNLYIFWKQRTTFKSQQKKVGFKILGYGIPLIGILLVLLFLALVPPPNTWDSMTYHMSRVAHWKQNHNVDFYATHILRQLHQPAFSEFFILNLQIIANDDQFANIPQYIAMLVSIVCCSLIAKEFGLNSIGQLLATAIAATIPMGIMQSTSTQNDYVLSSMLASALFFSFKLNGSTRFFYQILFSLSIALALATKGTAYLFSIPILFFAFYFLNKSFNKILIFSFLIFFLCLLHNFSHYSKNFELYGKVLGPGREGSLTYANEIINPQVVASNLIRNTAIHLATPIPKVNQIITDAVIYLNEFFDIPINSPINTWGGIPFFLDPINPHEDGLGNFFHIALLLFSFLIYSSNKNIRTPPISFYVVTLIACFLIFSAYLKWQPWHSRLQLPIFILWSPFIAYSLSYSRFFKSHPVYLFSIIYLISIPWIFFSSTKPLIAKLHSKYPFYKSEENVFQLTRNELYFINRPKVYDSYTNVAAFIRHTNERKIGLIITGDEWEYPLFALLENSHVRIIHLDVDNDSSMYSESDQGINLIIAINKPKRESWVINNKEYYRAWTNGNISAYRLEK